MRSLVSTATVVSYKHQASSDISRIQWVEFTLYGGSGSGYSKNVCNFGFTDDISLPW